LRRATFDATGIAKLIIGGVSWSEVRVNAALDNVPIESPAAHWAEASIAASGEKALVILRIQARTLSEFQKVDTLRISSVPRVAQKESRSRKVSAFWHAFLESLLNRDGPNSRPFC
jgi:hypothetical protein